MHMCDVAELLVRSRPEGVEWLDGFADDSVLDEPGPGVETNVVEMASWVAQANRALVE